MPALPKVPAWFTGADDPWLTRRMRDIVAIEAGERQMLDAAAQAMAVFLDAARVGMLGATGAHGALTAAPGDETAPEDETPPDLNAWPEEGVWRAAVERFINPVVEVLFGEKFKLETAKAVIKDYPWRQSYLAEVWSRLKIWPVNAWEEIRPEIAEALAEGEGHREVRARIGRVLGIDAPTRKAEAQINALTKTINDPATPPQIRREAKARRASLYRAKDLSESRWWWLAARIARTETLGALNGGTYYGATAYAELSGEERHKQWWCLHPDMVVQARGLIWAARREHDGDMVHVTTRGGAHLALTPSHPVLTVAGWVLAGELACGARLVRLPEKGDGEPIGGVVEACLERGRETRSTRMLSREHDEVTVAPAAPDLCAGIIPPQRSPLDALADTVAEHRLPGMVSLNLHALAANRARRAPQSKAAQAVDRLALDEVTGIETRHYQGPVYDLTTRCGYFAAAGLIVHNSTSDDRVRNSHWAAHMQVRPLDEKFRVGGYELRHPGDPEGPGHETINCRCSLLTLSPTEAEKERERYEAYRKSRTDRQGREIDEDGQIVASAHSEVDMPKKVNPKRGKASTPDPVITATADSPDANHASTVLPWGGVLAPLGFVSSDWRRIDMPKGGALSVRPSDTLPLLFQEKLSWGHDDAVQGLANIRAAWIGTAAEARELGWLDDDADFADDQPLLLGQGNFNEANPQAVTLAETVRGKFARWVSVDLDNVGEPQFHVYRDGEDIGELELDDDIFFLDALGLARQDDGVAAQFGIELDPDGERVASVERPWKMLEFRAKEAGHRDLFTALRTEPSFRAQFGVELQDGDEIVEVIDDWRLMAATLVSQPAFPEAYITMLDDPNAVAEGEPVEEDLAASTTPAAPRAARAAQVVELPGLPERDASLVAAAESWAHRVAANAQNLHEPPAEWFENPNLDRPTNPTVTEDGRVFGHVHDWKTSHIGYPGRRVTAPESRSNYAFFNLKPVRCADGSNVKCGALVLGTSHAPVKPGVSANAATDHYDHTGYRVARIRCGRDKHGTWFSGALVPGVTAEQVLDIAELTVSGDWREGELRAALLVNVPGLPIVQDDDRPSALAASAMVAAGVIPRSDWGIAELAPAQPGYPTLVADVTDSIIAALDKRDADREEAARQAAAVVARQNAVAALAARTLGGRAQSLAAKVYGPRAARTAARVMDNPERRRRLCAGAAAAE